MIELMYNTRQPAPDHKSFVDSFREIALARHNDPATRETMSPSSWQHAYIMLYRQGLEPL